MKNAKFLGYLTVLLLCLMTRNSAFSAPLLTKKCGPVYVDVIEHSTRTQVTYGRVGGDFIADCEAGARQGDTFHLIANDYCTANGKRLTALIDRGSQLVFYSGPRVAVTLENCVHNPLMVGS